MHLQHVFWYISSPQHDYEVKPFNARFYRGREHKTTNLSCLKLGSIEYLRIQLKGNSPTFHNLTKFEQTRIYLVSDVFTTLVVVVA